MGNYHPGHSRFYVVAASLVCFRFGLPDRKVDRRTDESVSFVVRRLVPKAQGAAVDPGSAATYDEQAWATVDGTVRWIAAPDPTALVSGEERHPMFPLRFRQEERPRTLWSGFVPVVSSDATPGTAALSPARRTRGSSSSGACDRRFWTKRPETAWPFWSSLPATTIRSGNGGRMPRRCS